MRLIDADVMHGEIDKYDSEGRISLKNTKRYIDAQPTAYDVDKVVEELEESSIEFELFGSCSEFVNLAVAIDIVKRGGVDDNTRRGCEEDDRDATHNDAARLKR